MDELDATKELMRRRPVAIITIGMAGAGKSTFVQRINAHLHASSATPYVINLDPAVSSLPYEANIDIRDTVDYKEVMKQSVASLLFFTLSLTPR